MKNNKNKEKIIIFGTGDCARKMLDGFKLDMEYCIVAYSDNNKSIQETVINQIKVISPEAIDDMEYDKIIICSMYYKEIYSQLVTELKIPPDKIIKYLDIFKKILLNNYNEKDRNIIIDEEIDEICKYIQKHDLTVFNYDFNDYYDKLEVEVTYDEKVKMFFIMHEGKKMYFKRSFKDKIEVLNYYRSICKEQDINSPHRYLIDEIQINNGDVVIDAGVAEGNFALDVIDKVSKIYLIEVDHEWVEALKETFKAYSEKVEIIEKFLTDFDDEKHISLDSLSKNNKINFIKMDIEGSEVDALKGAENILKNHNIKLDICSYHRENDETEIKEILNKFEFYIEVSRGYMCYELWKSDFLMELKRNPSKIFRRGLVRGVK